MGKVYIIGTCDTKEAELLYAKALVVKAGADAVMVDVGTKGASRAADVAAKTVASHHPDGAGAVLGLGGSGNTALVTQAMRALPIGTPKLMVSTVASGNVAPYVGPNDIAMMYSVVDIAGLNSISRKVIGNAAHAVAGMAMNRVRSAKTDKPGVGMTMFGVTTACVTQVREQLDADYDCYVFHATGTGGQSMEKLAESGLLEGVVDTTTTEVPDLLFGGVFPCTEDRFGAIIRTKLPYVGSLGAIDMVNFGAMETVPARFAERNLYVHNPQVTLMRTTPEENREIGEWIVARLNRMEGPVRFLLPLGGVSAIDSAGMPFHDPAASAAAFDAVRNGWKKAANRKLINVDANVNDPVFAAELVKQFKSVTG